MSVGLDRLLFDIEHLAADDLAADACEWLGAAIARRVDISPRLAAIVMGYCGITAEQLRAVVDRHLLRRDAAALARAGRAAERQVSAAQSRVIDAARQHALLREQVAPVVQAAADAWQRLLSPELLSPHQAELLRAAHDRQAAEQAALDAAHERYRLADLRLISVQEQVHATARSRPGRGTATARRRYRLDDLQAAVDALRDEIDDRELRLATAKADREHLTSDLLRDVHDDG